MKKLIGCIVFVLFVSIVNINAQSSITHKSVVIPFQGAKGFCEFYQKSKYIVTIKNNIVIITFIHNQDTSRVNGKIINGKLYTDDSEEKKNKNLAGKYYLLTKDMIRILNIENGDYNEYDLCK